MVIRPTARSNERTGNFVIFQFITALIKPINLPSPCSANIIKIVERNSEKNNTLVLRRNKVFKKG